MSNQLDGYVEAPEFPDHLQWLNVSEPLSLRRMRGKVVLLDFWTYCCINCMHLIPDLKRLEAKYGGELVVIGVHSAKFDNEKEIGNIRAAIERYEIEHPVINDSGFEVWRSYGVRSWPTVVLINPRGRVVGSQPGEGLFDVLDQAIGQTVAYFDRLGEIDRTPLTMALEREREPATLLSFPGKIAAHEPSDLLAISDSNHNRIVLCDLAGAIRAVIGGAQAGLIDGTFEQARFFRPQGLCFDPEGKALFIADTENHAIRKVDLGAGRVETLAGNGTQARSIGRGGQSVPLNSPWDLCLVGESLYIAMAGPHQLWRLDLRSLEAQPHAGSGREDIIDGPLAESALAQPSGIVSDGSGLYFADSEVSSVRVADIDPKGGVRTLIGQGLFDFGDVDGDWREARLQHPLGVARHDGRLYVADTYNHKIKLVDVAERSVRTLIGSGVRGLQDGPFAQVRLNEPSGLCFAGGRLYIADCNNHVIRIADLAQGRTTALVLSGLEKLGRPHSAAAQSRAPVTLAAGAGEIEVIVALPAGRKLNPLGPSRLTLKTSDPAVIDFPRPISRLDDLSVSLPSIAARGEATVTIELEVYSCEAENAGACFFNDCTIEQPLRVADSGAARTSVRCTVEP